MELPTDVGPIRLRNLIQHFGTLDAALSASVAEWQHVDRIGPKIAETIMRSRNDEAVEQEIAKAAAKELRILCPEDHD